MRTSSSIALLLILVGCGQDPTPPPASVLDAVTVRRLFERMDRLVQALEGERRTPRTASPDDAGGSQQRVLVSDDRAELLSRLEALELAVSALRAGGSARGMTARPQPAPPLRAVDVEQFAEQLGSKQPALVQQARSALFLRTEDQILEQLGMPTESSIGQDGSTYWTYKYGERSLNLGFKDGRAVYVSGR